MEVGKYMLFSTYIIHKYTPSAAAQKHVHCCTVPLIYLFPQAYAQYYCQAHLTISGRHRVAATQSRSQKSGDGGDDDPDFP